MSKSRHILKVILMDYDSEHSYNEGGLRKLRQLDENGLGGTWETIKREFDTDAERRAYIEGLYDMSYYGYTTYAILANNTRI